MTKPKIRILPEPPEGTPKAQAPPEEAPRAPGPVTLRNRLPHALTEGLGHPVLGPGTPVEVPALTNWLRDQVAAGHVELIAP